MESHSQHLCQSMPSSLVMQRSLGMFFNCVFMPMRLKIEPELDRRKLKSGWASLAATSLRWFTFAILMLTGIAVRRSWRRSLNLKISPKPKRFLVLIARSVATKKLARPSGSKMIHSSMLRAPQNKIEKSWWMMASILAPILRYALPLSTSWAQSA